MEKALTHLFTNTPAKALASSEWVTIWLEKHEDKQMVKYRQTSEGPALQGNDGDFAPMWEATERALLLQNSKELDVTINGVNIMITKLDVLGGTDLVLTSNPVRQIDFASQYSLTV